MAMAAKTGSSYISGTMADSIEIRTTNSGFSMMMSSIKVQPNDFDNERLPEIASAWPTKTTILSLPVVGRCRNSSGSVSLIWEWPQTPHLPLELSSYLSRFKRHK